MVTNQKRIAMCFFTFVFFICKFSSSSAEMSAEILFSRLVPLPPKNSIEIIRGDKSQLAFAKLQSNINMNMTFANADSSQPLAIN